MTNQCTISEINQNPKINNVSLKKKKKKMVQCSTNSKTRSYNIIANGH